MKIIPIEDLPYEIEHHETLWIPLPDGGQLAMRLWLPKNAWKEPCPVIMEYLPYRFREGTIVRDSYTAPFIAGHNVAYARIDIGGTGDSQNGVMLDEYTQKEQDDALIAIAYLAEQKWCNGSVAMMGISWGGFNGLQVAALQPPALKLVISLCSTDDRFRDDIHYKGAILAAEQIGWGNTIFGYNSRTPDPKYVSHWRKEWEARLNAGEPYMHIWMRHPFRDSYWKHGSIGEDPSRIKIPVLLVGGFDDLYVNAMFRMMNTLSGDVAAIIGSWSHKYPHFAVPGPEIGFLQEVLRWSNQYLRGVDTGVKQDPRLRFYLLNAFEPQNEYTHKEGNWYQADAWPPKESKENIIPMTALPQGHIQCPANTGTTNQELCVIWLGPEWPGDQAEDDKRSLTLDIDVVGKDISIVGAPVLDIRCKSNKPEAHVFVRLCDVAPNGKSTLISYGVLNLTLNQTMSIAYAMEPDVWHSKSVVLNNIAYTVPKGHKLRIAIHTHHWPMFVPPPEPVTLTIDRANTHFRFQTLTEELVPYKAFAPSEGTPKVELEIIETEVHHRTTYENEKDGSFHREIVDDFGKFKNLENGLIAAEKGTEHHQITKDGRRTTTDLTWDELVQRDDIACQTQARVTFKSHPDGYSLTSTMTALLNNEKIFEKTWNDEYPRNYLVSKNDIYVKAFMRLIVGTCNSAGVRLSMRHDDHVIMPYGETDTEVSGYFDQHAKGGPILCFATQLPFEQWFSVAIHEYHHMEQWIENLPEMMNIHRYSNIWRWFNHEIEMDADQVELEINANIWLELDAEKRSLAAIIQYQLPIDPKLYAKQANAYLYGYLYAQHYRDWLSGERAPYKNETIVAAMPDHFNGNYTQIDQAILDLYDKHFASTRPKIHVKSSFCSVI